MVRSRMADEREMVRREGGGQEEEEMWTGIIGGNDKRGELAKWRYTGRTRWNNGEAMKETIKRTGFRCCGRVSNSGGGHRVPLSKLKNRERYEGKGGEREEERDARVFRRGREDRAEERRKPKGKREWRRN